MSKKKYYIFLNTKSDTIQTKFITKQRAETTEYTEDKKHPHTLMHPPTPPHTHTHTHTHTHSKCTHIITRMIQVKGNLKKKKNIITKPT